MNVCFSTDTNEINEKLKTISGMSSTKNRFEAMKIQNVFENNILDSLSPELLSNEDTIIIMNEILRRVLKSNEMLLHIKSNQEFNLLITKIFESDHKLTRKTSQKIFTNVPEKSLKVSESTRGLVKIPSFSVLSQRPNKKSTGTNAKTKDYIEITSPQNAMPVKRILNKRISGLNLNSIVLTPFTAKANFYKNNFEK